MKKFLFIFMTLFFVSEVFPQNTDEPVAETETITRNIGFIMQFEPGLYLNTESRLISAPSPIVYPVSAGIIWPENAKIAIQPMLSFFMMNHLFYDGKALPAEIENRTTTTLAFMLNIPAVYSIFLENSRFQITGGLGIFMRFGLLSPGVKEDTTLT